VLETLAQLFKFKFFVSQPAYFAQRIFIRNRLALGI